MYRHTSPKFQKDRPNASYRSDTRWEVRELKRLLWVMIMLLAVFLGKKIYPNQMLSLGENVVDALGRSTDMSAVFSQLGKSMESPAEMVDGLGAFCLEVFGPQSQIGTVENTYPTPILPETPVGLLSSTLPINPVSDTPTNAADTPDLQDAVPAVGTVLTVGQPQACELPSGYTMDELSFGALETVSPVIGTVTSEYGYRDHPISGIRCFHGGVDIGANAGTPISAFADGQVEYVGEDTSYGLYFQIDHGDEIKSFYAHCQQIHVTKGQTVRAGETVALVGDSGTTTGPHLHLELKCGETRVDPTYYLTA